MVDKGTRVIIEQPDSKFEKSTTLIIPLLFSEARVVSAALRLHPLALALGVGSLHKTSSAFDEYQRLCPCTAIPLRLNLHRVNVRITKHALAQALPPTLE